eukprot:4355891-Pyramimonas_sp.AAC.1
MPVIIHKFDPSRCIFATASDCGGVGSDDCMFPQQAWQVYLADNALAHGQRARATPLAWRSCRVKRQVASTLAGETLALSGALAEAQWLHL